MSNRPAKIGMGSLLGRPSSSCVAHGDTHCMQIRILGCSGGIGGKLRTTSFLVDDDILVDAGTGVGDLSIEAMANIDHIFITHSHLDHILSIPLLADTVIGLRKTPVTVHATRETWQILQEHLFNWKIWPDFTVIPNESNPILRYSEVALGQAVDLDGRVFTPVPALHTVPAVGYHISSGTGSLVFTGDTTNCDALWQVVNQIEDLRYLIIETAFGDEEISLARLSRHLSPLLLSVELDKLKRPGVQILITHFKPGEAESIMREIGGRDRSGFDMKALSIGQMIEF